MASRHTAQIRTCVVVGNEVEAISEITDYGVRRVVAASEQEDVVTFDVKVDHAVLVHDLQAARYLQQRGSSRLYSTPKLTCPDSLNV